MKKLIRSLLILLRNQKMKKSKNNITIVEMEKVVQQAEFIA